jgi:hypothetical protein
MDLSPDPPNDWLQMAHEVSQPPPPNREGLWGYGVQYVVCRPMSNFKANNNDVQEVFCRIEIDDDLELEVA